MTYDQNQSTSYVGVMEQPKSDQSMYFGTTVLMEPGYTVDGQSASGLIAIA